MTASVPRLGIGAEFPLSWAAQSTLGTAEAAPTFAINQTENTIHYDTSAHTIQSAVGTRAAEAEGAQGRTMTAGGFACTLRTANVRALLEAHFGGVTPGSGTEVLAPTQPALLTAFDSVSGEVNVYQDLMLNELTLQSQRQVEWTARWTVLGGLRTVADAGVTIPTPDTTGRTLAWSDTSVSGIGSTTDCQIGEMTITLANNVQQFFGSGSHAACALAGGIFSARLQFELLYSDANAAAVEQDYADGTHLSAVTVTITDGVSDTHVIVLPQLYITRCEPQRPIGELVRMRVEATSLDAGNVTYTLPSA